MSQRVTGRFHPPGQAELAVDGGQVPLDGGRAEVQLRGDLLVAHPRGQQPQHFSLAGSQPARQRARGGPGALRQRRAHLGQPLGVAQLAGQGFGGAQVAGSLVGPAEPAAGAAEPGQRLDRVVTVAGLLISRDRRSVVPGRRSPLPRRVATLPRLHWTVPIS